MEQGKIQVSGSQSLVDLVEKTPSLVTPVIQEIDDVPLVCFLHMNGVTPEQIQCKPGTNFVYFTFHNSQMFRDLQQEWYDGAKVVGLEYARASRYIFGLIKRLKEGDYIRLAGRVGIIKDDDGDPDKETREFDIEWQGGIHDLEQIYLLCFPGLEVGGKPIIMPFPLKAAILEGFKKNKTEEKFKAWLDAVPEK